jgi:hypothetical protein
VFAGGTTEMVRRALGASADVTTVTADVRGYLPGFASHHVVAVRAAGGASSGDAGAARTFLLGGGAASNDVIDFGREAFALLRGFPPRSFAGTRAAVFNVEYRWPIARIQRGVGTWPFFLHTVHAAIVADAGHAWTRAFRADDIKTSLGGELSFNLVAGYFFPVTATIGAAWGRDGADASRGRTIYARVGRSF